MVKLYADEPGHETVRTLGVLVVSCLARVEVPAALWRKHRIGELDAAHASTLTAAFEADWFGDERYPSGFIVLDVPATLLNDGAALAARHGLRAYDAIQLASALAARAAVPECGSFVCFDSDLRDAAAREGLELVGTLD